MSRIKTIEDLLDVINEIEYPLTVVKTGKLTDEYIYDTDNFFVVIDTERLGEVVIFDSLFVKVKNEEVSPEWTDVEDLIEALLKTAMKVK
jgi:hypothetical protein